jgi:signal transduction histidine kinase
VACSLEEAALGDWLGAHGLPEGHEIAPPLVAFGFGRARVKTLAGAFDPDQLPGVLAWLSAGFEARALLSEIGVSARVISEIVTAVKRYAYLDEAPVQEVDLEESLETTLIILRHKLREGVEVRRDYGTSPPTIEAHGSELTQVWTNLIDNAVEAMGGKGTLEIRIRPGPGSPGPDFVEVEVEDSGPGIPESIRSRIFDPFFTTKGPGSGSGLGLHIVYNTVVDRHRGRVAVESEPGRTLFRVTLPLRLTLDRP